MQTFVEDIIPNIKRYSQKLDNLALLTNQHWVILDELVQSKTVYIFRQTNELLISTNGKVEKAKWEYLGQNSILIDLKDQSFLFRHGFCDENILALKFDSKEEYVVLINESKYKGELNSISAVLNFLNQNYIINPVLTNKQLGQPETIIIEFKYQRDGYTFKMGSFKELIAKLSKKKMDEDDLDRPLHFSFEAMPENEERLSERNAYLLRYGITPILFPRGAYDYIEQILRSARNETRYNGYQAVTANVK